MHMEQTVLMGFENMIPTIQNEIDDRKQDAERELEILDKRFKEYQAEVVKLRDISEAYKLTCERLRNETKVYASALRLLIDIAKDDKIKDKHKYQEISRILLGLRLPERSTDESTH